MRHFWIALFFLALCGLAWSGPARAELSPPKKKTTLQSLQKQLLSEEEKKAQLENKRDELKNQLDDTRKRLVSLGQSVQQNERLLQDLEAEMADLQGDRTTLTQRLENDRAAIASLVLALERIRRVPPQALLVKPGAPYQTAQSALLMSRIIPVLNDKAEKLSKNLNRLEKIKSSLHTKRNEAILATKKMKKEQDTLSKLIGQRESLYAKMDQDIQRRQGEIRRIAMQASSLQDLLQRLEANRRNERKSADSMRTAALKTPEAALPKAGKAQMPISGKIRTYYDMPDSFGAASKGLVIEGRPGALAVAPMGGIVRFTGTFRNYGNMVIIEHQGGYHSLIAGLEKIDTVVGHNVTAGEPVGMLVQAGANSKPLLYYELRLHGRPINPAEKFAGLS